MKVKEKNLIPIAYFLLFAISITIIYKIINQPEAAKKKLAKNNMSKEIIKEIEMNNYLKQSINDIKKSNIEIAANNKDEIFNSSKIINKNEMNKAKIKQKNIEEVKLNLIILDGEKSMAVVNGNATGLNQKVNGNEKITSITENSINLTNEKGKTRVIKIENKLIETKIITQREIQ